MRKTTLVVLCLLGSFSLFAQNFADSLRAFPGAEGYGAYVTGGRGGRVAYVLHTDDVTNTALSTYKNSFRAALEDSGTDPLTVVFMCGGVINLVKEIRCSRSNLTIAGQTALGDGICLKGYGIKFSGQNVIVRYMRFRPGDVAGLNISCVNFENGGNFIFDHCTFSWSVEENMTVYDNNYSTVQWCMLTESLYVSIHDKGKRAYAAQWGGQTASYHHNLLAHHNSRMPRQNGARSNDVNVMFDYRNNLHYNWGGDGAFYGGDVQGAGRTASMNIINNYYIPGPSTTANKNNQYFCAPSSPFDGGEYGKWWLEGNVMKDNASKTANQFSGLSGVTDFYASALFPIPAQYAIATSSAEVARDTVLQNAGATFPMRDSLDRRVVREIKTGTYTFRGSQVNNGGGKLGIIDSQADLMPAGETTSTWNPWYSHYRTVTLRAVAKGKVNVDTFLVETFVDRDVLIKRPTKTDVVKMRRVVDTDKDGMPDWWEKANGLNPNDASDRNLRAANGYTMLEIYLNGFPHLNAPEDGTDDPTGIAKKHNQPHLRVCPNPVTTQFSIETILTPKQVDIYNLSGVRLSSFAADGQQTFSTMLLRKGIYFVKVTFVNGEVATQRIVK